MEINVRGTIVNDEDAEIYRWFGYTVTCPQDVRDALAEAGKEDVTVHINSAGGSLFAGFEIYSQLRAYHGDTVAYVESVAASAATLPMVGCKIAVCEPVAVICIHNPWALTEGDAQQLRKAAQDLDTFKDAIINGYVTKSNKSREELAALMNEDRYMNAQEAVEMGLIDRICGKDDHSVLDIMNARQIPVITQKMRDIFMLQNRRNKEIIAKFDSLCE